MKSSIKKRFQITRTGKVMHRKSGFNHFRAKKSSSSKQGGRKKTKLRTKLDVNA